MVVDAMRVDLRIGSAGYTDMDKLIRGSRVRLGRRRPMHGLVWWARRPAADAAASGIFLSEWNFLIMF